MLISNLSLKTISLTHFTNKINITALDMKYCRQSTEPGRFKLNDSCVARLKAFSGIKINVVNCDIVCEEMKKMSTMLLMVLTLIAFISSSDAVRCYRCDGCNEPDRHQTCYLEHSPHDVCVTNTNATGELTVYCITRVFSRI